MDDFSSNNSVGITLNLNGKALELEVPAWESALEVIRRLGFTGTKEGCGIGECGACTVIVDGKAVDSCLMLAAQLDGKTVQTVEGLGIEGALDPIQESFLEHGAVQCGFCTPGMVMSAKALLERLPEPKKADIVEALSGNLCRCTGYVQIIEAVAAAARSTDKSS